MSDRVLAEVFPPGEYILDELEARGWRPADLAWIMGVHANVVSALLSGRRGISAEMSKKLGAAFDVSPEFFLNLQAAADMAPRSPTGADRLAPRAPVPLPAPHDDRAWVDQGQRRSCRSDGEVLSHGVQQSNPDRRT